MSRYRPSRASVTGDLTLDGDVTVEFRRRSAIFAR